MQGDVRVTIMRTLAGTNRPIERIEEGEKVRYTNVMLLGPGEWTDAASRQTLMYAADAIKRSAENWIDPRTGDPIEKAPLNHYHEHDVPAENVGHIPTDSVDADEEGHLYGDVVFHMRTQRSEEMEAMMKLAMEEDGQEGLGGISVEIPKDETEWDSDRQLERMTEMWFSGAGLVMNPASATVNFADQSKRAVALSGVTGERTVYTLNDGETTKRGRNAQGGMGDDPDDLPDAVRRLRTLQEQAEEVTEGMSDPTDMALDALGTYLAEEGNAREDDLTSFRAWAQEALDPAMADPVMGALEGYMSSVEGEEAALTVGDFMSWAEGTTEEEPPAEGEGEGEGPPAEPPVEMANDEVVATLESIMDMVQQAIASMQSEVSETENEVEELRAEISDLERSLEAVQDEEVRRTLGGHAGGDDGDGETAETTAPTPIRGGDGYLTR